MVVSLDATMACDTIEWPYMFAVLRRMRFSPNYISWIKLLYREVMAQVVVNNRKS